MKKAIKYEVTVTGREVCLNGILDFRGYSHERAVRYATWMVGNLNRMKKHVGSTMGSVVK